MTYETKKQQQDRFIAEFLRRVREAPPGERVYMAVGDLFKPADVHDICEKRASRRRVAVNGDGDNTRDKT